jgi:hypothetical protein
MLLGNPRTVNSIAREVDEPVKDVEQDLQHLLKSLKHSEYQALIEPARCRKCNFEFSTTKLTKPSRCPECKGTWLEEARISLEERK